MIRILDMGQLILEEALMEPPDSLVAFCTRESKKTHGGYLRVCV